MDRAAKAEAVKRYRAKRRAELEADPTDKAHGRPAGYTYGCTCFKCKTARSEYNRKLKEEKKARERARVRDMGEMTRDEAIQRLMYLAEEMNAVARKFRIDGYLSVAIVNGNISIDSDRRAPKGKQISLYRCGAVDGWRDCADEWRKIERQVPKGPDEK